jgi:acetolactate synthase-1/2/3 large subunit
MTKRKPTKYSDQLIDWLVDLGYTHCFFVAGGNIMHLLDSARTRVKCIPVVHEVAAGIAAEYFNQISSNEKAFALVTAGPGLTNIVTAMSGAWLEHRELLVVGGQVKSADLMSSGMRQRGIQEIDGVSLVASISKNAVRMDTPLVEETVKGYVSQGFSERHGPVFLEVCLDVQGAAPIAPEEYSGARTQVHAVDLESVEMIWKLMNEAERPVWLLGAGISRQAAWEIREDLEKVGIPILTTWHGADRVSSKNPFYFGRPETWGQRSSNLIINQADLVVVFGARLGFQETGFNWEEFAPNAKLVQIEIDQSELAKGHPKVDIGVCGDANSILSELVKRTSSQYEEWVLYCREIRELLPLNEDFNETRDGYTSPYDFYLKASEFSMSEDIWIPASSGGANSVAIQALNQWGNQKVVCDNGLASMGYGLSGAIGAAFAQPKSRVWLIEGDGGFSQNLQELATVAVNQLNIKIFIFANEGYGSIRTTQKNYFDGAYLGCDTSTGLGFPDWHLLGNAYGIPVVNFPNESFDDQNFSSKLNEIGPLIIVVAIDPLQTYWPKITSRVKDDGGMESNPLSMMSPDLPQETYERVSKYL